MTIALLVAALLGMAVPAAAQEMTTTVVPVVGSTYGPTAMKWLTDVEIANTSGLEVDVAIELVAVPEAPVFAFTLAPGQVQRFVDIVGQAFGIESALSPLRITNAGRRPVAVRASAYAVRGAEVSPPQELAAYSTGAYFPIRVLDNLSFSETYRTNVGLLNFGTTDAYFTLALQRVPGRNLAVTHITVPPATLQHMPIQSLFPLITEGHGFAIVVETGARETYVYASVIENTTSRGTFVTPRLGAR
jgi:hypothetical protein